MKQTFLSTWRFGSLACLVVFHLCTVTASRAAILAGPITNAANGHIYYLLSPTNWPSAEAEAVSLHGHLATINDVAENTWVFNTFASYGGVARNLWLGLNDAAQEGNWVWVSGEASAYLNWAPGEPNSGGGFFPDEDQAVMRGPALSSPGSWNDAPGDQVHTPVVELGITAPPANTGAYNVASGFSTNSNPNGAWSYGSSVILGAPMTLFSERGNWAGFNYWRAPILLGVPGVYHNPANISVTNSTGTAILGPGQLSFYPGPSGEFCVIRFTAPTNGQYQVIGAFTGVDPHGTTTDVHVLVNGVIFNGSVNGYGAGSGPTFNLIVDLNTGDPIDFAVGRSANSQFSFDSTGLSVQISTSNAPPAGIPPTITSQPQSQTVTAGTNVTFFVTATGTTPLSYQWRRNATNVAGATGTSLTLSNVQPANAGTYSVRVTNAFGTVISSNAVLTVLAPSTNCGSAPTGLVSWWRAEGNAKDAVGTNNGTAPFGMSYAAGEVGGAFDFNGTNASVSVPAAASLDVGQGSGFSIECWIKPAQIAAAQPLVEWFQSPGPPFGVHFWISEAGSGTGPGCLYVNIPDTFGGEHKFSSAKGIVGTNSWQHVALTYERASGLTKMFYNGTVVASQTLGFYTPQTSYGLYLGRRPPSTYPYQEAFFNGGMDEVAIYNRALSTNEIQAIFNAGSAGRCPPPTGIPPTITSQPQSRTVNVGTNVTFFVTATGTTPLSYQWRRNATNLPGATGTSLTLTNVQAADAGTYSVRVTNAFGSVTSSNAVLTVLAPPTNCVSAPTGLVSWWRAESNAVDSVDSNHGTLAGNAAFGPGRVGYGFVFDGLGDGVSLGNPTNLQLQTFTCETWFRRISTNRATSDTGYQNGGFLHYGSGGYGFAIWDDGRLLLTKVGISATSSSVLRASDTNFHHAAVTKSGSAVIFYLDGVPEAAGAYDPGFVFNSPVAIGARGGDMAAALLGTIDELSVYNHALSASEIQGIYAAGSAGKCPPPAGIPPTIISQPQSRTVNAGTNVTFLVTATGTTPLSYQWRRNETNLPGATGTSLTLSDVQPANAGTYSVRVTNAFGAVYSSNAVLTVLAPPSPILAGPVTNPANGHVYYLIGSNTWTGAEAQAVNLGGHLVTINDATENAWVLNTFGSFGGLARPLWIGLNDAALEGAFVWVSGEAATYRNWMPGEPNNGGGFVPDEDYVAMRGPGLSFSNAWNDTLNSDLYVGVVEIGQTVSPTNCVSAPTGLVSWWWAESNTVDSVDNNHGTLAGNATFGVGRVGQGFVFDGNGDGVGIGNPTNLQLQNFTIEAWVRRASSSVVTLGGGGGTANFFCYGTGGYAFGLFPDGRPYLSKVEIDETHVSVGITDTNFHHVAVTKSGSNVVFYIDGIAYPVSPYNTIYTFATPAAIGARGDNLTASFYGAIDELAIYNRALATSEIQAIYGAGSAGKCGPAAGVAPAISIQPQSQTVSVGANVTFFVTAGGTTPLSYQWRRNTTNLAGATGTSLTLSNVQLADAGTYSVRVTNAFGVASSSNAVLTVLLPLTNCAPPPSGLVSWWPAENNANDIVDGNHGTLQAVSFAAGKVGQAFEFNGTTSFISVPASANLNVGIGSGFAVEGWINPSTLALQRPIVEWNSGSGSNPYGAHFWISAVAGGGPGCLFANLVDTLGVEHFLTSAGGLLVTNSFQHVALTYDKSSGVARLFLNGIVVAQSNLGIFTPQTSYELSLGRRTVGFSQANHWAGKLDEIAIYNRALGSNEIAAIYAAGSAGKCPSAGVAPTITSHPTNQTVAAGTNVTFTVAATGTAPLSYQWRRNATNVAGATGTSLTLSNVQPANAGTYSVRVTNAFGTVISSNAVLTVAVAAYDVSANYSLTANPNGVWRYGALSNLGGPLTLLTFSRTFGADNGVPIGEWNPGGVLHPHVNKVLGPGTAVSAGGAFVGPAGTVYFTPGEDRTAHNFGVIRFTVPAVGAGNYRIATAVQPLFDGALSADADFHVDKNGVELFGAALSPNQGTGYSNTVTLAAGDTIDFAIGRGADGILGTTGLKIQATVAQLAGTSGGTFVLTSLVREPGTTAKLCFAGVSGNTYTVQASTNLIDWKVVGIAVADSNGVCEFEDTDSTKFPCRYYRIVVPH